MKPFEVWNPFSGRWFILHWWTDADRGHLAFASTEDSLLNMADSVFKKEPHAECKGIFEIEIVGPSDRMNQIAAKYDLEEEIQTFTFEVFAQLSEAKEAGKTLPSMFLPCSKYEPEEGVTEDDWAIQRHYECKNCLDGISLVGMTRADLHARFHADWKETKEYKSRHPKLARERPLPQRAPSTAPKASDDEPLRFAHADFGHHAGGVELHEVDLAESDDYRPKCLARETLFFYRFIRDLRLDTQIGEQIAKMSAVAKLAWEEESERRDAARREERERERAQRIDDVIDFFTSRESAR